MTINNIQVDVRSWFPTQIISAECPHLASIAKDLFDKFDFSGCEHKEYPNGVTSYYTGASLPEVKDKDILTQSLQNICEFFAEGQGVDLKTHEITLTYIWLSRMYKGGKHPRHAHGMSHYSGSLYVSMPKGANGIRFHHPAESVLNLASPPVSVNDNHATISYVDYSPVVGSVLIWNSWLCHEVLENHMDGVREVISFNFYVDKK